MRDFTSHIELMHHFKNGDEAAVKELYKMFYKSLCYFISKIAGDQQEAEDIATECFLKIWDKRQDFENLSTLKSYLFTAARNRAVNLIRQKNIHEKNHRQILYLEEQGEDLLFNEEVEAEILRIIYEEIEALPTQCKEIFKLLSFERLNTAQVAEKLGLSPQTVRNQKTKALQQLRIALQKRNIPASVIIYLFLTYWVRVL